MKLIIAYDGAGFSGWQSQANGDAIQNRIEAAFAQVVGQKIRVHGAGRTDAGVHALGQCAHADVTTNLEPATVLAALNASLPPPIRILRCRFVAPTFHARFDACGKIYRYRIATTAVLSPFELGRAWHVSRPLDETVVRACAQEFVGQHDFARFAANRGRPVTSTTRTIRKVRVRRTRAQTTIEFEGDGFLYKMVRLMVGAIVRCGLGRSSLDEVRQRLRGSPSAGSERARLVAPAAGLTLVRVLY
ncbi:MAG TPA: tRNA pseudouridine(38-40) synthase TruA [Chthoniobacterales bacterium]|nr:tRNA pseudouridine(38-40) synthase TruA [Chthoniobacterales bacterium]